MKCFLTQSGYDVQIVQNGPSALEALLATDAPHIAVIDWMMPDLDGPEVCRRLRQRQHAIEPYVLMLTGKKEKAEIAEALDAGADDILTKPFNILEMRARLRVAERHIQRQLKHQPQPSAVPVTPKPAPANAVAPVPPPATGLLIGLNLQQIGKLAVGALAEMGVENAGTMGTPACNPPRAAGFAAWSGFLAAADQVWLDLVLEIESASANSLFSLLRGDAPVNLAGITELLGEIHGSLVAAITGELQTAGAVPTSPFPSVACRAFPLRLPEDWLRQKYSVKDIPFELTIALQPCPLRLKAPRQLNPLEVLAESYPRGGKEDIPLLKQGAVLNERFIEKILSFDLSTQHPLPVPIFQPPPIALDFIAKNPALLLASSAA